MRIRPLLALTLAATLTGCATAPLDTPALAPHQLFATGSVHGGQQPVIGAQVYLYAVANTQAGPATSLLKTPGFVLTDPTGSFSITGDYTCPANSYVYLLAKGGSPSVTLGVNPEIALASGLGPCASLTPSTFVVINEVTTVAAAYSLAAFATSETQIGSPYDLRGAFSNIALLANTTNGAAAASSNTQTSPLTKVNSLANTLAACINSTGMGAPCSTLMSAANVSGGNGTPVDTFQAALNIAQNPTLNVGTLFALSSANQVFAPALPSAPANWTLPTQDLTRPIGADANSYRLRTNQGDICIELRPEVTPQNVANFLTYVNSGTYNQSFIHRVVPNFIAQGGGYTFDANGNVQSIPTNAPVAHESGLSNLRGSIAMARVQGQPNSATSQFFFNLADNPSLDTQDGGYSVFAQVQGIQGTCSSSSQPLAVMDAIAAVPTYNLGSPFDAIPLLNYTSGNTVQQANFVSISTIAQITVPANTVATPVFSPGQGTIGANQTLTLTDSTPGASISYYIFAQTNGGYTPTPTAVLYTGPFTVPFSTFVIAFANLPGYTQSATNYEYYSVQ